MSRRDDPTDEQRLRAVRRWRALLEVPGATRAVAAEAVGWSAPALTAWENRFQETGFIPRECVACRRIVDPADMGPKCNRCRPCQDAWRGELLALADAHPLTEDEFLRFVAEAEQRECEATRFASSAPESVSGDVIR